MDLHAAQNVSTAIVSEDVETRPYISIALLVTGIIAVLVSYSVREQPLANVPLVTKKTFWDFTGKKAREAFAANARAVIKQGFAKVGASRPFRIISDQGEMLILPPSLANDIRNIDALSHAEFMKEVYLCFFRGWAELTGI